MPESYVGISDADGDKLVITPAGALVTSATISGPVSASPSAPATANTLTAASGLTTGTVYDLGYLSRDYTYVITSTATLTAGVIRLFGSIDNSAFVQIGSDISATADFPSATTKAYSGATNFRYLRADITTVITGGTVTAKVMGA